METQTTIMEQLHDLANEPIAGDSEQGRNVQMLCDIPLNAFRYDMTHEAMPYVEYVTYWSKHATIALVKRTKTIVRMYVVAPAEELLTLIDRTYGIRVRQVIDTSMMDNDVAFD